MDTIEKVQLKIKAINNIERKIELRDKLIDILEDLFELEVVINSELISEGQGTD